MPPSTLIENGTVVTVDAENRVHPDGAVLVEGDTIVAVGDSADLRADHRVDRTVDASGHAVLPGFVDLHLHSGFIRGLAEDMPVFEWLNEHVDPTHEALDREEARVGYELCYAEMASAGITTAMDMYRYMDEAADVAEKYGVRVTLAPYVADEYDYFETLEDNRRLVEERHGDADGNAAHDHAAGDDERQWRFAVDEVGEDAPEPETIEPETPELENTVFVLLGVVLSGLVFYAALGSL